MIAEYTNKELSSILFVINDAAKKYKGVIPNDCWNDPYMSEQELVNEFSAGVRMYGYNQNNKLVGVMGNQKLINVTLIRHAYTLTAYQGRGVGKSLLNFLFEINQNNLLLVGTWQDATWAIRFYEKFGFVLQENNKKNQLLKKYWNISSKQIKNSVVLKK